MKQTKNQSVSVQLNSNYEHFVVSGGDGNCGISFSEKDGILSRTMDSHGNRFAGLAHITCAWNGSELTGSVGNKSQQRCAFRSWATPPLSFSRVSEKSFVPVSNVTMGGQKVAGVYKPVIQIVAEGMKYPDRVAVLLSNGICSDAGVCVRKHAPHLRLAGLPDQAACRSLLGLAPIAVAAPKTEPKKAADKPAAKKPAQAAPAPKMPMAGNGLPVKAEQLAASKERLAKLENKGLPKAAQLPKVKISPKGKKSAK